MHKGFAAAAVAGIVLMGCGGSELSADAGEDFTVAVGDRPTFDGCGSEGDIENWAWTIVAAPSARADDVGKAIRAESDSCTADVGTAMVVDEVGTWEIELAVTTADGGTATDVVMVDVTP